MKDESSSSNDIEWPLDSVELNAGWGFLLQDLVLDILRNDREADVGPETENVHELIDKIIR